MITITSSPSGVPGFDLLYLLLGMGTVVVIAGFIKQKIREAFK